MLHLGSIGGTSIDVDFNFGFLVLLFVVINYNAAMGIQYALLWIPILFISVLVHELAHAGMIALFGFGASQIVLTGMGVTINRRRAAPWQDLLISLAGPFSSFGLYFLCEWLRAHTAVAHTDRMLQALLPYMAWANSRWGFFNLIPVPPLDGGHAVRDFFRMFLDERPAFVIAIWIAILGGGAVAGWMLMQRQFFIAIYIGWFVYMAFQSWQHFKQHGVPGD
ncbi:MAG TPA: M50 family metallopeptidase [Thermoanaerobaculia bacterium]|jgi:Zn-dependent protease|nr:M50 family metallopeptidase [Thermoanaerobaculia bacterium]